MGEAIDHLVEQTIGDLGEGPTDRTDGAGGASEPDLGGRVGLGPVDEAAVGGAHGGLGREGGAGVGGGDDEVDLVEGRGHGLVGLHPQFLGRGRHPQVVQRLGEP